MPKEPVLYEAMYIANAELSDEQIEALEDRLKAGLEGEGATVVSTHLFGRRRLAYPINGHREGIYRVMYFRGTGAAVDEIKHEFSLSEEVIRGIVLVANPKYMVSDKPPQAELAAEQPAEAAIEEAQEAAAKKEAPEPSADEAQAEEPAAHETPAEEPAAEAEGEAADEPVAEEEAE